MVGLPARARSAFIQEVEHTFVPVKASQAIHEAWFDSRLLRLEQGGHQKVLADPRVTDAVLALLAGRRLQARQTA